ncbi:MAG: c-type cytochrome domain-containing protein, partial [bacterium]
MIRPVNLWATLLLLAPLPLLAQDASRQPGADFIHDVVPILRKHCGKCHTGGVAKGDFSMDTRAALLKSQTVLPGKAAESDLVERIKSSEKDFKMPPEGTRLSEKETGVISQWINEGAKWEESFSFRQSTYEPPLKPR